MAADKTIANLEKFSIADTEIGNIDNLTSYADDVFLISHPMTTIGGVRSDYTTFKVSLSDLGVLAVNQVYKQLLDKISIDLNLGNLAHQNELLCSNQVGDSIVRLDQNVDGSTYGPLAIPTSAISNLQDIPQLCSNLGFKDLAFKTELGLELSALAHKDYITSSDVSTGAKFTSAQIDVPFRNLCLSDEEMLELSDLAHQNMVFPSQVCAGLSLDQILSVGTGGWKPIFDQHYLSSPTATSKGSIATGFIESTISTNRNYAVKIDDDGNAYVTVPWKYFTESTSCSITPSISNNTLILTQNIKQYENSVETSSTILTDAIVFSPYIQNNTTRVGEAGNTGKVAVFADDNNISGGALLAGNHLKTYREDGTFDEFKNASRTMNGFMTSSTYSYLYDLTANLPTATNEVKGAIKTGYSQNGANIAVKVSTNDARAFVTIPTASSSQLGGIKTGALTQAGKYPVRVDRDGNAYAEVGSGNSAIDMSLFDTLFPLSSIYLTLNSTAPLQGVNGISWRKIEGKYLFASGNLAQNETYQAGANIPAGLPNHNHKYSFNFSASTSHDGYPYHGGSSTCPHSSYPYTTTSVLSNDIYGQSSTVRPKGYAVNVFIRES